jgi:hypothetical protein
MVCKMEAVMLYDLRKGSMGKDQWDRINERGSKTFYLEKWETEGVRGMIREDLSGQ